MLNSNKRIRKLELEGNNLGPKSIAEFGRTLKHNASLKYLDLESNQLTVGGQEFWGIYEFVECLDHNKTLLSLNLSNNDLDEKCGQMFREKLEHNYTLIDFDFSNNNFSMDDSREIQLYLKRNKAIFDGERIKEWRERKFMRGEDQTLRKMYLGEQAAKESAIMDDE
jgi:hypothetical protein